MQQKRRKISVIVADDTMITREGLKQIISKLDGFELIGEADSIEDAVNLVESVQPDILLLDLNWFGDETAGINGIAQIKALGMPIKILAVTAYSHLLYGAVAAGADAVVRKGFSSDELAKKMMDVYEGSLTIENMKVEQEQVELNELALTLNAIVHRLGNLLGTVPLMIQNALEQLESGDFEATSKEIGRIGTQVVNASQLLERIGEISRPARREDASIDDVLTSALVACNVPDNVVVQIKCEEDDLPIQDAELLREAVINLLTNALEAMPDGGTLRITARPVRDREQVEISIEDSGSGVPDKVKARLFRPFITTKPTGQGLGLWLSSQLVRRLGGYLELESSTVDKGTTFVIMLPLTLP
jgi:signal transduction histidine kinase